MKTRKCKVCGKTKALKEYAGSARGPGGKMLTCRECWRANMRKGTTGIPRKPRNGTQPKTSRTDPAGKKGSAAPIEKRAAKGNGSPVSPPDTFFQADPDYDALLLLRGAAMHRGVTVFTLVRELLTGGADGTDRA